MDFHQTWSVHWYCRGLVWACWWANFIIFWRSYLFETRPDFVSLMITWVNLNGFSPNLVCALILWRDVSASDIMGSSIWNNMNIKINNTPVFYRRWYDKNIHFIRDLMDEHGQLLTYEQFQVKYNVRTNFVEFAGIRLLVETNANSISYRIIIQLSLAV